MVLADDTGGTFILVMRNDNSFLGGGWSGIFILSLLPTTVSHEYPSGMDYHVSDWSPIVYTARPVNDCSGKPLLPSGKTGEALQLNQAPVIIYLVGPQTKIGKSGSWRAVTLLIYLHLSPGAVDTL